MEKDNITYITKAKKNSFNPIKVTKHGNLTMKKEFLALIVAATVTISSLAVILPKKIEEMIEISQIVMDYEYDNGKGLANKYRWSDGKDNYGYNHEEIAEGVLNCPNSDVALSFVMQSMGDYEGEMAYKDTTNRGRVFELLYEKTGDEQFNVSSYEEFLSNKGYKDDDAYYKERDNYVQHRAAEKYADSQIEEKYPHNFK